MYKLFLQQCGQLIKRHFLFIEKNFHASKSFWKIYPLNNLESSVVVHEPELTINLALYGLWGLGSQYNVGTLPWFSLAFTPKCRAVYNHARRQQPSLSKKQAIYRHLCQGKLAEKGWLYHIWLSSHPVCQVKFYNCGRHMVLGVIIIYNLIRV